MLEFTDNSLLFTVLECYRIALVTQERAYKDRVETCQFRSEQQEQAWDAFFATKYMLHVHQQVFNYLDYLQKLNTKSSLKILNTIENILRLNTNKDLFGHLSTLTNLIDREGYTLQQPIENYYFLLSLFARSGAYSVAALTPIPIILLPELVPIIAFCLAACIMVCILHKVSNQLLEKSGSLRRLVDKLKEARTSDYEDSSNYTFKEFNKKTGRVSRITQVNKAKKAHPGALLISFFHKKLEPDADTPICAVKKTFEAEISAACKA